MMKLPSGRLRVAKARVRRGLAAWATSHPQDQLDDVALREGAVVDFAGGLGAQILAAATYWALRDSGVPAYADLGYFHLAPTGIRSTENPGLSIWRWELDAWGIGKDAFDESGIDEQASAFRRLPGSGLMWWGLRGLRNPSIAGKFDLEKLNRPAIPPERSYACLHIRRGDFSAVASHLLRAEDYAGVLRRISPSFESTIVVCDTTPEPELMALLKSSLRHFEVSMGGDPVTTHVQMRQSSLLVTANSQFGLVAAALQQEGISLIPTHWFAPNEQNAIERVLWHQAAWFSMVP